MICMPPLKFRSADRLEMYMLIIIIRSRLEWVLFSCASRCGSVGPWVCLFPKMVRFISTKDHNVPIPGAGMPAVPCTADFYVIKPQPQQQGLYATIMSIGVVSNSSPV